MEKFCCIHQLGNKNITISTLKRLKPCQQHLSTPTLHVLSAAAAQIFQDDSGMYEYP